MDGAAQLENAALFDLAFFGGVQLCSPGAEKTLPAVVGFPGPVLFRPPVVLDAVDECASGTGTLVLEVEHMHG